MKPYPPSPPRLVDCVAIETPVRIHAVRLPKLPRFYQPVIAKHHSQNGEHRLPCRANGIPLANELPDFSLIEKHVLCP